MDNGKFISEQRKKELSQLKAEIIVEAVEAIKDQGKYNLSIKCTGRGYYIKNISFGIGYKAFVKEIIEEISKKIKIEVAFSENDRQRYTVVELKKAT